MRLMLVLVRCKIFDGHREQAMDGAPGTRIAHVHEGKVLAAWREVEGNVGVALLDVASPAMIATLLRDAFANARHIDIVEVMPVEEVDGAIEQSRRRDNEDTSRAIGS